MTESYFLQNFNTLQTYPKALQAQLIVTNTRAGTEAILCPALASEAIL